MSRIENLFWTLICFMLTGALLLPIMGNTIFSYLPAIPLIIFLGVEPFGYFDFLDKEWR